MNIMPVINGKHFRCECTCNVFHKAEDNEHIYVCNACGAEYGDEHYKDEVYSKPISSTWLENWRQNFISELSDSSNSNIVNNKLDELWSVLQIK